MKIGTANALQIVVDTLSFDRDLFLIIIHKELKCGDTHPF
jgi:hypothetical protein